MALRNSNSPEEQFWTITTYVDGAPTNVQNYSTILDVSSLNVVPSPCHNGVGGKRPSAYRYTAVKTAWPRGQWIQQYEYGHKVYQIVYEGHFGTALGNFRWPAPRSQEDTIDFRALAKLYDSVRSSEVSLNTSIGEGRETLQMMRDIAVSARKLRKSLKKLSRDLVLNPSQTVGSLWLGWSVGLKPLLSDCENIRKHMANKDNDKLRLRPVAARASAVDTAIHANGNASVELSQRIQYGLNWQIADLHLFENWRLGLTTRPTLVWELTTLSFVVDYFVNIGQYLELLEASIFNNGIAFVDGYRTFTQRKVEDIHYDDHTPRSGESVKPSTTVFKLDAIQITTSKERRVLSAFPSPPSPIFKIPRASGPLLNVAALLSQILTRRVS